MRLFCFLFLFFTIFSLSAQEKSLIYGRVISENKKPVEFAIITIKGSKTGTETDSKGNYELSIPSGKNLTIIFSCLGYNQQLINLNLKPAEKREINITLQTKVENLEEINIEDIEGRKTQLQRINPKVASIIPGVSGGVEALIKTMPGVSAVSELSSQYSVRGGNFDENLVYVNDVQIFRPFLVKAGEQEGLSFVNSDLVSQILFSSGGFESRFGDKMSSVLDIKYKKPLSFAGSVSASLLGAAANVQGTNKNKKFTYLFGIRQKSNQYILKTLDTKGDYKPSFTDVQTNLNYELNSKWEFGLLANYSRNKYRLIPQTRETTFGTIQQALKLTIYFEGNEVDEFNTWQSALYATFKPNENTKLKFIASAFNSYEKETYDILGQYFIGELDADFGSESFGEIAANLGVGGFLNHARNYLNSQIYSIEHKGSTKFSYNRSLDWGIKINKEIIDDQLNEWNLIDSADYSLPHPTDYPGSSLDFLNQNRDKINLFQLNNLVNTDISLNSNRIEYYLQNQWNFNIDSIDFSFVAGLRSTYWDINNKFNAGPRATLSIKPLKWRKDFLFRFSTGYYFQPPFYRELRDFEGVLHKNLKSQTAIHFVGALDYNFRAWRRPFKFVGEIYYKYLYNLIPYEIDNVRIRYYSDQTASGFAQGFDLKLNGELVQGLESWASFSYLKTMENIKDDSFGSIPRPQDQRISFSLFFQDFLPANPTYKMHLNFLYGTGLPFGPANSPRYKHILRKPSYFRVDIGFSKQLKSEENPLSKSNPFRKFKNIWLSLEVFNLLQANNVISYIWVQDVAGNQLAVPNYLTPRQINLKLFADF